MAFCCIPVCSDLSDWLDDEGDVLAALSEATADTVSSEIGQAFGGRL